jgi:hypothetical protein
MELLNGTLCDTAVVVVDERKAPRPPRFAIGGNHDLDGIADGAKVLTDVGFGRDVREIPDE